MESIFSILLLLPIKVNPDEEPLIDEKENPIEPDTNEVQAEAGGMLRAAIDGLPVDLECTKEEPEENANADQLQSDVTNEEIEEKEIAKEVDDSNQGNISRHLVNHIAILEKNQAS